MFDLSILLQTNYFLFHWSLNRVLFCKLPFRRKPVSAPEEQMKVVRQLVVAWPEARKCEKVSGELPGKKLTLIWVVKFRSDYWTTRILNGCEMVNIYYCTLFLRNFVRTFFDSVNPSWRIFMKESYLMKRL